MTFPSYGIRHMFNIDVDLFYQNFDIWQQGTFFKVRFHNSTCRRTMSEAKNDVIECVVALLDTIVNEEPIWLCTLHGERGRINVGLSRPNWSFRNAYLLIIETAVSECYLCSHTPTRIWDKWLTWKSQKNTLLGAPRISLHIFYPTFWATRMWSNFF